MRIRLRDVSSLAGVSEATVSRVMNGKSGVSPGTRERVVRALADLGYTPPALHPREVRAGLIGLIVPELDNPIFPRFIQAIEDRLLSRRYLCVLCCSMRLGASEDGYVKSLVTRRVAGVIVISGRHADVGADLGIYDEIIGRGIALVTVNGSTDASQVPSVSTDDRAATATAYRHLQALGHERVGLLIGPRRYAPVLRKIAGFRDAAPSTIDDDLIAETFFTLDGGFTGAQRLFDAGATAIVAASDMMALGAIRAARERGLVVPDDVSIVGFDDSELMRFTDPPLTTMQQPVTRIVDYAVEVLLAQVEGRPFDRAERMMPAELIVRSTTGRAPTPSTAPIGTGRALRTGEHAPRIPI